MHRNKHPPLSMPPPLPSSIAPVVPSPFPSSRPTTTTSEDLGAMPFAQLMRLETVGKDVYRSIELPFAPGVGSMAFGGHVYAQAVWAAAQTIPGAMTVHNVTGHFLLPGLLTHPFIYTVSRIRTGGSYAVRYVSVQQDPDAITPCFICTCSFKGEEKSVHSHQPAYQIPEKYKDVLEDGTGRVKEMEEHGLAPGADMRWYRDLVRKGKGEVQERVFPGTEIRKVDMGAFNNTLDREGGGGEKRGMRKSPEEYRQLNFYRIIGEAGVDREWNLDACAHLYASDRNSMFLIPNAVVEWGDEEVVSMASLSHTVIFHVDGRDLSMHGNGKKKWYCQEAWTSRSGNGRGLHDSRIWSPNGVLVATTLQEGVLRRAGDVKKDRSRI